MNQLSILIIEDSITYAEYLVSLLGQNDYSIKLAHSGQAGLDELKQNQFNLVLLDLELPDTNGMQVLKIVRKYYTQSELPIVVVSASSQEHKIIKALARGANDYLTKPVTEISLRIKVNNLIKLQQTTEQLKHTNHKLAESEEKYRLIFENSPIGLISYNSDGIITTCNESISQILGTSKGHLLGLNMLSLLDKRLTSYIKNSLKGITEIQEGNYQSATSGKKIMAQAIFAPLKDKNQLIIGGLGIINDVTERNQLIEERNRTEQRLRSLIDVLQQPFDNVRDFLQYSLEQAITLSGSKIGYIYHYFENRNVFIMNTLSHGVKPSCKIQNKTKVHFLDDTGLWGDVVRQRKPILVNDFHTENPLKKGFPEGHVPLDNFMSIPVFRNQKIVGVIGVANKEGDYDETDVHQLSLFMETIWEVIDHVRAKQALKESEEQNRNILQTTLDGFWMLDNQGQFLDVNDAYCQMIGYSRNEILSMNFSEIVLSGSLNKEALTMSKIKELGQAHFESRHRKKDGQLIDFEVSAQYQDIDGGRFIGFFHDITQRKQAAEKIKIQLKELECIYNIIYIKQDPNLSIERILQGTINLIPSGFQYPGKTAARLVFNQNEFKTNNYKQSALKISTPLITNNQNVGFIEVYFLDRRFKTADQVFLKEEMDLLEVIAENTGKVIERKLFEAEINIKNTQLNQAVADKNRFISILAHDLKNPFVTILGFLNLLRKNIRKYDIDKIENQLDIINHTAKNTYELLDELLIWIRSQTGIIPFIPVNLNLKELCVEITEILNQNASVKNIHIELKVSDEIIVTADEEMLKTILRNLVSNAIKFTNNNGTIIIQATLSATKITIGVLDNGIGIPPHEIEQLFDGSRVKSKPGTGDEPGTGLGLSLCKEFVERHGGQIWVRSKVSRGSKFYFTVPLK